ncbi:MAG: SIMPL domain-containing protein [Hyphomonadaceae bacterium]
MRIIAAAFAVFSVAAPLAAAPAAHAQQTRDVAVVQQSPLAVQGALLSVSAEGKVTGRPDMATVTLGVQTEAPTAQAAFSANAQRMNALIAALRRAGVAERDIQTANVSVNPQYVYQENQPPRLTHYQASNTVNAKVRTLNRVGATLDAAVAAGGNTIQGVTFSYQEPEAVLDRARTAAMETARHRADLYARAAGMQVARIVSISEGGGYVPPIPMPMMARMEAAQAAPTPVMPGEVDTTATLNVVFELR